mmetsp:Transcript_724/g.733  ORF Transcript_724/g.733 Transcript_724/m.733 type:complete len:356 (-) Transcript_724:1505-2572(-)
MSVRSPINAEQLQHLHLQLGDIPNYPYVNNFFAVQVFLIDDKAQLKTNVDVDISIQLFYDEKPVRSCDSSLLVIESSSCQKIIKNGTTTIRIKLTDVSMNHDNKKFMLAFYGTSLYGSIGQTMTNPMLCIQHRLLIKDMKENPVVWYKDEGGREKSIDMSVSLYDSSDAKVFNRRIHLKLTLQYENGQDCPRQEILRLNSDSRLYIDETTGEALLRFRIDEVSRSHQKQLFRVLVSPDSVHYPLTSDISPDLSVPIEVRSKRNKKEKTGGQDSDNPSEKRIRTEYGDSPYSSVATSLPIIAGGITSTDGSATVGVRDTILTSKPNACVTSMKTIGYTSSNLPSTVQDYGGNPYCF